MKNIDLRLTKLEERASRKSPDMPTFRFIDDPEGVERCAREHPDALIIHRIMVEPSRSPDDASGITAAAPRPLLN